MMTSLSLSPPAWALDSVLDDELSISPPQGDESLAFLGGFDGEYAAEDPFAAADDKQLLPMAATLGWYVPYLTPSPPSYTRTLMPPPAVRRPNTTAHHDGRSRGKSARNVASFRTPTKMSAPLHGAGKKPRSSSHCSVAAGISSTYNRPRLLRLPAESVITPPRHANATSIQVDNGAGPRGDRAPHSRRKLNLPHVQSTTPRRSATRQLFFT